MAALEEADAPAAPRPLTTGTDAGASSAPKGSPLVSAALSCSESQRKRHRTVIVLAQRQQAGHLPWQTLARKRKFPQQERIPHVLYKYVHQEQRVGNANGANGPQRERNRNAAGSHFISLRQVPSRRREAGINDSPRASTTRRSPTGLPSASSRTLGADMTERPPRWNAWQLHPRR